ncbi:HD domain-containing protein [Marinobacterium jannaschii]|uniref:HD domain-containing protein n=1 Tax=Marinobacterium jannaschii TaxID=64970 RepID=UPI000683F196|nr:HD domain-containing phosphohydrolase [Marinobacterium jannaschii]
MEAKVLYLNRDLKQQSPPDFTTLLAAKHQLTEYRLNTAEQLPEPCSLADYNLLFVNYSVVQMLASAQLCGLLQQAASRQIPCIVLGNHNDGDFRDHILQLGFCDYLCTPLTQPVLNSKIQTHLNLAQLSLKANQQDQLLDQQCDTFCDELATVQDAAILCLAAMARMRDQSTGDHILRTQQYVKALAEYLRFLPEFEEELNDDRVIELIYKSAALHDIGKVGIADHILQKPGPLSSTEYAEMKNHALFGYNAVRSAERLLEREPGEYAARFLSIAKQITLSHHERWDGKGYPQGLTGSEIPLVARIMAVADVYDAVISQRPYKSGLDHEQAHRIIVEGRCRHFDPAVVDAFDAIHDVFSHIAATLETRFPPACDYPFKTFPASLQ